MDRRVIRGGLKWIDKPDSVMARNGSHSDHSSCPLIAQEVERPYPRAMNGPFSPPIWPCSRWGLPCARHHWRAGELLPRRFTLATRTRAHSEEDAQEGAADCSLWHFPRGLPHSPLASISPCGARTFLPRPAPRQDRVTVHRRSPGPLRRAQVCSTAESPQAGNLRPGAAAD